MNKKRIHKVLDNGLNIYFYPDQNKHSVFIGFMVKYGAFHSDFIVDGQEFHMRNGMAHLLEHLLFEKNRYGNFAQIFGERGMQTNATTSTFMTDFYVDAVEEVDFALEHLIKGISNPIFTKEDIEVTKPPIYQEIRMRNDEIGRTVYKSQTKNMLKNYTYIDGLGTIEDVESFTYEQVKLCYDTFYRPKNEILFIAGNFDVDTMYKKIQDIYSSISVKEIPFSFLKKEEPKEVACHYEKVEMPISKDFVSVCYKVDFSKYSSRNRRMLSCYIDLFLEMHFSSISSLYKELVEKKVIDYAISYDYDYFEDYLLVKVSNYTNEEEVFVDRVREVFEKERNFKEEVFRLDLQMMRMSNLCSDMSLYGLFRQFHLNYSYYDYDDLNTAEDLQTLNFEDFKKFIGGLEFKEYLVTKITDVKN